MFVDTAKVQLHAGKGGDGAVSFRHEIYVPKGGPDGGDGGRGGSIIFRADKDTNTLLDFRYNPILRAENGKNGAGQRAAGRSGKDLIVEVPVGTVVYKVEKLGANSSPADHKLGRAALSASAGEAIRTQLADLVHHGQTAVIAKGGDGGFGNAHFKSSTRQTPRIAEVGEPGEEFEAELELKLLADVGLVGLPNAGKSTFLSVVSNARPEIADYPFTTITPNLGVATIDQRDLLIADIPGLIEGASEGRGLGHAFLRHVDRTAVLLHLVDAYNDDAGAAYRTIRTELERYSDLATRPEVVALTKIEGLSSDIIKMQADSIRTVNPNALIYEISAPAHQGVDDLLRALATEVDANGKLDDGWRDVSSREAIDDGAESSHPKNIPQPPSQNDNVLGRGAQSLSSRDESARKRCDSDKAGEDRSEEENLQSLPTIKLSDKQLRSAWQVSHRDGLYYVTGEKIEKFARRTDLSNYESVNRLRDILKKLGIRAELTNQGAGPDSIISIAGKEFTLVEDY